MRCRRLIPLWFPALLAAGATDLYAAPFVTSRPGGLTLTGPAIAHPASQYLNPAVLGLLPGHHVYLDGTLELSHGAIARRPIDAATGEPTSGGAGRPSPEEQLLAPYPTFFFGAASDLGLDSVVVGLAVHNPMGAHVSFVRGANAGRFDPASQGPLRYHATDLTAFHVFVTPAAAIKLLDQLSLGISFSYVFGLMDLGFVRDAALDGGQRRQASEYTALDDCGGGRACGYEADAAAEGVRVRGTSNAVAFSVGLAARPHRRLTLGAAYHSPVIGLSGQGLSARGSAWIRRATSTYDTARSGGLAAPRACTDGSSPPCRELEGRGTVNYALPDMVTLGGTLQATRSLLLALQLRWLNYSRHDQLDLRLTGAELRHEPEVPERVVHYRGFRGVFAAELGASYRATARLELQGGVLVESAAVPSELVTPLAIDALKVDLLLAARLRLWAGLSVQLGYNLVAMPPIDVDRSAFRPAIMVECVDRGLDMDLEVCQAASRGQGLPSAAGRYQLLQHRLGLGLAYDVD